MNGQDFVDKLKTVSGIKTNKKLAEELGLPETHISKWKNGSMEPDIDTLLLIAEKYNVSIDYLLGTDLSGRINNDDLTAETVCKIIIRLNDLYDLYFKEEEEGDGFVFVKDMPLYIKYPEDQFAIRFFIQQFSRLARLDMDKEAKNDAANALIKSAKKRAAIEWKAFIKSDYEITDQNRAFEGI